MASALAHALPAADLPERYWRYCLLVLLGPVGLISLAYHAHLRCLPCIPRLLGTPLPATTLHYKDHTRGMEKRETSKGGIAVLLFLPFNVDVSGWGHRAPTTCLAISAGSVGVGIFSFSFEPSAVPSGLLGCLQPFQQRCLGARARSTQITFSAACSRASVAQLSLCA